MTGELIGWAFRCRVCNETHLIQKFGYCQNDHLYFPYHRIVCPNKNISKVYSGKDFTMVRGKAEWKGGAFEKESLAHSG